MVQFNFDPTGIEPGMGFGPPPPEGIYDGMVVSSDIVKTQAGDGDMLVINERVMSGPYAGREVIHRFNIRNPNQRSMEIGYAEIATLCKALGIQFVIQDSQQLHGIPHKFEISHEARRDGKPGINARVTNFLPATANGAAGAPQAPQAPQQQPQAPQQQPQAPQQQPQAPQQAAAPWQQPQAPQQQVPQQQVPQQQVPQQAAAPWQQAQQPQGAQAPATPPWERH